MKQVKIAALLAAVALTACEDPAGPEEGITTFVIEVSGEQFRARVADTAQVRQLEERRVSGIEGVVSGELVTGDGGFNAPWSWHLDATSVHTTDLAIELCDGRPSMVEDDLEYWLESVGQFCPWGATVVARE